MKPTSTSKTKNEKVNKVNYSFLKYNITIVAPER